MKHIRKGFKHSLVCCMIVALLPLTSWAEDIPHPRTYVPTHTDAEKNKAVFDDPRPYLTTFGPKQLLPAQIYERLCFDIGKMKTLWAELVGFRSPDLVGKIAPEIKPGKYTYLDKEKYPGFKELMWPNMYERFCPGGPPYAGNIPEFEIVPTKQYYWALPVAELTKRNLGKTKLDDAGYIEWKTWEGGFPFPRPSGELKAQQIIYSFEKKYNEFGQNFYMTGRALGFNKDLKIDLNSTFDVTHIRLAGRCLMPPYGWYDKQAEERGEIFRMVMGFHSPRDIAGAAQCVITYLDPYKMDQAYMYIPSLRRIRKMSATDTQDPAMGLDAIYDDNEGFRQKLSPVRYPYTYELLEEREYLCAAPTEDGAIYISSEGWTCEGLQFQRRPVYVVKLTQQDRSYVYGHRIMYIDKEIFQFWHIDNFDQKGRLYRTYNHNYSFFPEMGLFSWGGGFVVGNDYIDTHSTLAHNIETPAFFDREDASLQGLVSRAK